MKNIEFIREGFSIILSAMFIIMWIVFVSCGWITYFTKWWGWEWWWIFWAWMILGVVFILWGIRNWYVEKQELTKSNWRKIGLITQIRDSEVWKNVYNFLLKNWIFIVPIIIVLAILRPNTWLKLLTVIIVLLGTFGTICWWILLSSSFTAGGFMPYIFSSIWTVLILWWNYLASFDTMSFWESIDRWLFLAWIFLVPFLYYGLPRIYEALRSLIFSKKK